MNKLLSGIKVIELPTLCNTAKTGPGDHVSTNPLNKLHGKFIEIISETIHYYFSRIACDFC